MALVDVVTDPWATLKSVNALFVFFEKRINISWFFQLCFILYIYIYLYFKVAGRNYKLSGHVEAIEKWVSGTNIGCVGDGDPTEARVGSGSGFCLKFWSRPGHRHDLPCWCRAWPLCSLGRLASLLFLAATVCVWNYHVLSFSFLILVTLFYWVILW